MMSTHQRLYIGTLLILLAACGKFKEDSTKNLRGSAENASEDAQSSLLQVTGSLKDGEATSQRVHSLGSRLNLPEGMLAVLEQRDLHPKITLMLRDSADQVIYQQSQDFNPGSPQQTWNIKLEGDDGLFTLSLDVDDSTGILGNANKSWKSKVELDTTEPQLAVEANFGIMNDEGKRPLVVRVSVRNERDSSCFVSRVEHPGLSTAVPFSLQLESTDATGLLQTYSNASNSLLELDPRNAVARVACKDRAGNISELVQPILTQGSRSINLRAKVQGNTGRPLGAAADSPLLTFAKPGSIKISSDILDATTGLRLADKVLEFEKSTMRIYITDSMPASAAALLGSKSVIWTQAYAAELSIPLPGNYTAARTLYMSLIKQDAETGKDVLVSSLPLAIYVDESAPTLSWVSPPRFAAPVKDAPVSVTARIQQDGAPLAAAVSAQYSVDGKTWSNLQIQEAPVAGEPDMRALTFAYPLAQESPFRLQLKATDLAGNNVTSVSSPQIIGRAGLSLAVNAGDRALCKAGNNPLHLLRAHLASSFVCKKADLNGTPTGADHAQLIFQNRGLAVPEFYKTVAIAEGMGYRVLVDGQMVESGRYLTINPFRIDSTTVRLLPFPLKDAWLLGQKVEVLFDVENTDANSTTNACYTAAEPYARVVIQDKALGLTLKSGVFPCDAESSIQP
jgi:hypothetical protein